MGKLRSICGAVLLCAVAATSWAGGVNPMVAKSIGAIEEQLGKAPATDGQERIGVLVITLSNPYWVTMKERYGEWAKEMGISVEVMAAPTEKDLKSQLNTLEAMVAKEYDGIIVTPMDPFNLIPGVVKANEKGIPVVCSGPEVDRDGLKQAEGTMAGWISATFQDQGLLCAKDMAKSLPKGSKVAIIEGIPGAGQSRARRAGATEGFEEAGLNLVAVEPGNWDRNQAYNIATNLIKAHPDLRGIYCANDVMALAAVDALEVAGVKDVAVYGTDFIPEAAEAIKAGRMAGSTTFSQAAWTRGALLYTLKLAKGDQDLPEKLSIPITLVTGENISEFDGWR